ncbi:Cell cycle control protein [Handroanthus impetiginosus]|uniref:ALA-interacting subunit n=1 Tax=Handroanthus impetiginosus TaxID=429701 RepID=A0A2G9I508_9LAMI|nr:Cell cycle control protein [Handroanthus impetiginosus]
MSSGDGSSYSSSKISKKPRYSRFTQQELPACKPILTPGLVITILISLAIIFIPIGLSSLSASQNVVEVVDRYDDVCVPLKPSNSVEQNDERIGFIQDVKTNKTCIRTFIVPKKMKHPIFVYYQLDNFYQNHRRYVKSRSDHQLWSPKDERNTKLCEPEAVNSDNKPIVPCGLIAWSLFNDTYSFSINNTPLTINKKGIAWTSDRTKKFGPNVYPKNFQTGGLIGGAKLNESIPLSEQEDLIVWMRTAALPSFRKLYGKIETDLEANEKITVVIQNNYNTYSFNGRKKLVISTATWIGGKNDFLGKMYITVGATSLFLAVIFLLLYVIKPRPLGDPTYLSWNRNPTFQY